MKIIFLDVDGVLNAYHTIAELDESYILNLKQLVNDTHAIIVLSSSWQVGFTRDEQGRVIPRSKHAIMLSNALNQVGLSIHDMILKDESEYYSRDMSRSQLIDRYLSTRPYDNYVILDDEPINSFTVEQQTHLVHTYYGVTDREVTTKQLGFCDAKLREALQILKGDKHDEV